MLVRFSAAALNHLLAQSNWALPRLARFAGKTARFNIAPLFFAYKIQADGTLRSADIAATADVVCTIAWSLLPRLALREEKAYADLCTEGDAALLAEIFFMMRNLRWDVTQDLSSIGNITERVTGLHVAAETLSQMAADYLTEEHPLLVRSQQVAEFMHQVNDLRDGVARIEQRIEQLLSDQ